MSENQVLYNLSGRVSELSIFSTDYPIISESIEAGTWSFICRDERLHERVCAYFGRRTKGTVVKIWQYPFPSDNLDDVNWGRYFNMNSANFIDVVENGALLPALKAQNFASRFDLAPAIYGMFAFRSMRGALHPAILCQDARTMSGAGCDEQSFELLRQFCDQYGINPPFGDLETRANFVQGIWVDWQYSRLLPRHIEFLKKVYLENTQFGDSKYQKAPGIGVDIGIRDTSLRIASLGLDRFEFRGSTVVDIGCNGGQFLNYAAARGMRYGCGLDWDKVVQAADYVSNYLGHFNIRYLPAALHESLPDDMNREPYDLILMLSMTTHIGTPDYLHTLGKRMILEVNHPHQIEAVEQALAPHWWYAPFGKAGDHGDRQIFHAYNKGYFPSDPFDQSAVIKDRLMA